MSSPKIGGSSEMAVFYSLPKDQEGGMAVELPSVAGAGSPGLDALHSE